MWILQHNCRRVYAVTIAALEAGLQLGVGLACLQEPYVDCDFQHTGYLIYWPEEGERRDARVAIAVRRDWLHKLVVEARTDLFNHPYLMAMDVWELGRNRQRMRRTRVINCYDAWIGAGQRWQGSCERRRRAIEDADWNRILMGRCLMLGDLNAHSPQWNSRIETRINAAPLEELVDRFELLINNTPGVATRPKPTGEISVIHLTLTSPDLGSLSAWLVDHEHATGRITAHRGRMGGPGSAIYRTDRTSHGVAGWQIQALQADPDRLTDAAEWWKARAVHKPPLTNACTEEDLVREATWIRDTLTTALNQFAKPLRVCVRSKRWWTTRVDGLADGMREPVAAGKKRRLETRSIGTTETPITERFDRPSADAGSRSWPGRKGTNRDPQLRGRTLVGAGKRYGIPDHSRLAPLRSCAGPGGRSPAQSTRRRPSYERWPSRRLPREVSRNHCRRA